MMNICLHYQTTDGPWGGANQFLKTLGAALERLGHVVTTMPSDDTEVILLNSWSLGLGRYLKPRQIAQLRATGKVSTIGRLLPNRLYAGRRRGPVVVHRVDGVAKVVRGNKSKGDRIQVSVNGLADHTVFQSAYCRSSFDEHLAINPPHSGVIHNAVDPNVFYPSESTPGREGKLRLLAASWSSNPLKGFATLADISKLPGVELTFVGNWCDDVAPANVLRVGVKSHSAIAAMMRSSHAFVQAAWHESCSNTIVEALGCGLPVIYRDSGGNKELASEYGVPFMDDLSWTLDRVRSSYGAIREAVLRDRSRFLIDRAAQEYLAVFRSALDRRAQE